MLNVVEIQDALAKHLDDSIPQKTYEQGIPDIQTLKRDASGKVPYYVAYQFGMPQAKANGKTFCGVTHDDYVLTMYVQVVGPDATEVRKLAYGEVLTAMLGFSRKWTAQMEQRAGGAVLEMTQSTGATEAYVAPLSFGVTFQMNPG